MEIFWMHRGGLFLFFLLLGTVSGMDPSSPSIPGSQLSTLGSQLMQLQEQVEALQQDKLEDKEQIVQLMNITEELGNRVSLLESKCGSAEMETDTDTSGFLMAIGGSIGGAANDEIIEQNKESLRSAEVVNSSCDFPLPEARYDHISVTTTDGKILVCGGITSSGHTTSCLQFDYESKSWKEHSTLSSQYRYRASAVTLSRGTYVLGGDYPFNEELSNDPRNSSELLATGSNVWTQGPHIPSSGVWNSCVAKLSDTEFVILGGGYRKAGTQAIVYSEDSNEWREWPRLTEKVSAQSCVGLGDIVLMAGGKDWNGRIIGRTVIFDTKTGSAREVASLKYPRAYGAIQLYGGKPLILGGYDTDGDDEGERWTVDGEDLEEAEFYMMSDGEMWNMETETWDEADIHLNIARKQFSLVTMPENTVTDCQ